MADENETPETDDADGDGEEGSKKKGLPKLVLFGGLGGLVVVLGAVAAVLLLGGGGKDTHAEEGAHGEELAEAGHGDSHGEAHGAGRGEDGAHKPAHEVVFYELEPLLVNIGAGEGRSSYLKLQLTLELDNQELVDELNNAMPRIMDRYQSFLRELRVEDLSGSAGSYRLSRELLRRINLAIAPSEVRAVLIQEMLIQ